MIGNKKRGSAWGGTKVTAAGMPLVNQAESLSKTNSRSKSRRDARFAVWGLSILTLVFGFALAGCGGDEDPEEGKKNETPSGSAAKWVAVGGCDIAASTNGETWTKVDQDLFGGLSIISGVAYGKGKWVAVGGYSGEVKLIYSTNGTSWADADESTNDTITNTLIKGIVYGGASGAEKFVAFGSSGKIVYSTNGAEWSEANTEGCDLGNIYGVAYGNGKWVAVGGSGKIAYSSDGTSWIAVTAGNTGGLAYIFGVAYGGTGAEAKFVAVGYDGKMAYSTDGTSWQAVAAGNTGGFGADDYINGVAYGGGKFVVVGSLGKIATSTNGTSWQAVSDSKFSNDSALYDKISGVVYGGGKFVAFGQKLDGSPSHEVGYSADGETWTLIDGDSWVAFPANGTVAYGGN